MATLSELSAAYVEALPFGCKHKGVTFAMYENIEETVQKISDIQFDPENVVISSFSNSGTMWSAELVSSLLFDCDLETVKKIPVGLRVPYVEFDFQPLLGVPTEKMPQNRAFVSHLLWQFLPKQLQENRCKIIYISRNPKDIAVSFYHYHKMAVPLGKQDIAWDDFLKLFLAGELLYGSWFDHVLDFYKHNKDKENVLFLKYEDLMKNFDRELERILKFLNKQISEEDKAKIKEHCQFKSMAKNPNSHHSMPAMFDQSISKFMRKGIIGDWKNHFTPEQNETFDKIYQEKMAGSGLHYDFE